MKEGSASCFSLMEFDDTSWSMKTNYSGERSSQQLITQQLVEAGSSASANTARPNGASQSQTKGALYGFSKDRNG